MDRIALPIGSADFKDIRTSGDYYVDKTTAISQLVHDSSRAILFTRPRRFGKTTFITMLRYFFDIREKSEGLFEGLKILQDEETCAKWLNKVPVIYLTLKDIDGPDFTSAFSMLQNLILDLFQSYEYLLEDDMPNGNRMLFKRILDKESTETDMRESLKVLVKLLNINYGTERLMNTMFFWIKRRETDIEICADIPYACKGSECVIHLIFFKFFIQQAV